jgi:hypothetical protein
VDGIEVDVGDKDGLDKSVKCGRCGKDEARWNKERATGHTVLRPDFVLLGDLAAWQCTECNEGSKVSIQRQESHSTPCDVEEEGRGSEVKWRVH